MTLPKLKKRANLDREFYPLYLKSKQHLYDLRVEKLLQFKELVQKY